MASEVRLQAEQRAILHWLDEVADQGGVARYPGGPDRLQHDLMQRLDALPVRVPNQSSGAVTLLYSGPLGNTESWQVAEALGRQGSGHVVTIGQTPLGQLQNHDEFKEVIARVGGSDQPHLLNQLSETRIVDGRQIDSIWDRASARLAHAAEGDVRTLTPSALDSKVFASKELPAVLENPKVTHINGVPIEAYRHIHATTPGSEADKLSRVNMAVQASSYDLTREMRWHTTSDPVTGRTVVDAVDSGAVFDGTPHRAPARLAANGASFDMRQGDPSLTASQLDRMEQGRTQVRGALDTVALRPDQAAEVDRPRIRAGTVLKGLGVAGTAYGVYEGYGELREALDGARSTREWHVRGAEASADLAARATVTGSAATVGGLAGGAGGTLVAPGPGTVGGAVLGGGAAAYGAERAYENSRLQQWARALGRAGGEIGYDHFSLEGRLLRRLEGLQTDLTQADNPQQRQRIEQQLATVGTEFKTEVDRNNTYFEGRELIGQQWPAMSERFPGLRQGQVVKAYEARLEEGGQDPARAVQGAFSDVVHERVQPRGLPHVPTTDYAGYGDQALTRAWSRFSGQRAQAEQEVSALERRGPQEEPVPLLGSWLGQRSHDASLQRLRNAHWQDGGHVQAIEGEMRSRGMPVPERPAASREATETAPGVPGQSRAAFDVGAPPMGASSDLLLGPRSQRLLQDSEREVAELAQRSGLPWEQGLVNTSAAVAASARAAGLERVSLLSASQGVIHVGHFDGTRLQETTLDAKTAANTPAEQSMVALAEPERALKQGAPQHRESELALQDSQAVGRSV